MQPWVSHISTMHVRLITRGQNFIAVTQPPLGCWKRGDQNYLEVNIHPPSKQPFSPAWLYKYPSPLTLRPGSSEAGAWHHFPEFPRGVHPRSPCGCWLRKVHFEGCLPLLCHCPPLPLPPGIFGAGFALGGTQIRGAAFLSLTLRPRHMLVLSDLSSRLNSELFPEVSA